MVSSQTLCSASLPPFRERLTEAVELDRTEAVGYDAFSESGAWAMELQTGETEVTRRVLRHLDSLNIEYERLEHEPVTTSEAAAGARASRIEQGAKALIVKADQGYYHLIISAALRVNNKKLRKVLGTRRVRFATAEELLELTGCLPGAVPPFGNLFGLPVLMDEALLAEETVYFNCGSHTISLRMAGDDLLKASGARVEDFH